MTPTEELTKQIFKEAMKTKLRAVAEGLGGKFEPDREEGYSFSDVAGGKIILSGGERISVRAGGYDSVGRIKFYPAYPGFGTATMIQRDFDRSLNYDEQGFKGITVSDKKAPEKIVGDLKSRFLPTFLPLHEMAVAHAEGQRKYASDMDATKKIADTLNDPHGGVYVKAVSPDRIKLEISTGAQTAEKVVKFLKTLLP